MNEKEKEAASRGQHPANPTARSQPPTPEDSDTYVEIGDISGQGRLVALTTEHATSSYGQPVLLIDGKPVRQNTGDIVLASASKVGKADHPLVQRYVHTRLATGELDEEKPDSIKTLTSLFMLGSMFEEDKDNA